MSENYIQPEAQDPENIVVPEDAEFAEEMTLFLHLANAYPDEIEAEWGVPASIERINAFETKNNIWLTDELKAFYLFADGFYTSAANLNLFSLGEVEASLDEEWEWGDTKHYILLGDMIGDGETIHLDLDTGKIVTYDHGDETEYPDLSMLLSEVLSDFVEIEDDDELNDYLDGFETTVTFPDPE